MCESRKVSGGYGMRRKKWQQYAASLPENIRKDAQQKYEADTWREPEISICANCGARFNGYMVGDGPEGMKTTICPTCWDRLQQEPSV